MPNTVRNVIYKKRNMNQKYFVILFIIITISGFILAGANKFSESTDNKTSQITPAVNPLFNEGQSSDQVARSATPSADSNIGQISPKPVRQYSKFPGLLPPNQLNGKKAVIETDKGKIEFEIYPEATSAASNFIFLSRNGFYDGLTFHRVEPGFVIQGGDPLGSGQGGPGYSFADEPVIRSYSKGIVAMANAGPNTNGSQFFIMLADRPDLPPNYTIFGGVISGQEIVDKIAVGDIMRRVTIGPLR